MSENSEECPSQVVSRDQGDVFKCLILSKQRSKTLRFSAYSDVKQERRVLTLEKLKPVNVSKSDLNPNLIIKMVTYQSAN